MIDPKQLPVPKYKVGDMVWVINYKTVKQVEILTVIIEGEWFDNNYTSRHNFKVRYEVSGSYADNEKDFYNSKRTAQRRCKERLEQEKKERLASIKNDFQNLKTRCKYAGITIDDL